MVVALYSKWRRTQALTDGGEVFQDSRRETIDVVVSSHLMRGASCSGLSAENGQQSPGCAFGARADCWLDWAGQRHCSLYFAWFRREMPRSNPWTRTTG